MLNSSATPTVTDCIFWGNLAFLFGGGMYNDESSPAVTNCTFANNRARYGGGIANTSGTPTVKNCIVWGNLADSDGDGMFNDTSIPIVSYSDVQDLPNATPDGDANFAADPLFVDAPNGNLRLELGSPCQNAGDNAVVASPPFLSAGGIIIDLDGFPRISDGRVDLGAYEIQEALVVAADAGENQTVSANGACQAAVTLDGSGSTGRALTFTWSEGASFIANGANPQITLSSGNHVIVLTVDDGQGNTGSDFLEVLVTDTTPPVPDAATLATLSSHCSVTITTPPTATDICDGAITGVTTDPLTYTVPGFYVVSWLYADGNGNDISQQQQIEVLQDTPPVPNAANLSTVSGQCSVTITTVPTATDNCAGTITGVTTDPLTYTVPGFYVVTWRYVDSHGNESMQSQYIDVAPDTTPPVPNAANLPTISGQCSVTITTVPTATDNCAGGVTGVTTDPLTYTVPGTYTVTWKYSDGKGNSSTQQQTVIVQGQALAATTLTYNGATSSAPGATVTLSAGLSTGTGKKAQKLAGQPIRFTLGTSTASAVTDATGTARVTVTAPALAGSYALSASFAGTCSLAPGTVSKTFAVRRK